MSWLGDMWKYGFTAKQRAVSRDAEQFTAAIDEYERALAVLPVADARAEADRLLASSPYLRVTTADQARPLITTLGAELRGFFTRIRRVEASNGESYIDVRELAPYEWDTRYLRIGQDGEHAHVTVRAGADEISLLFDDAPPQQTVETSFPTIHHWVLWLHRTGELLARSSGRLGDR